MNYRKYLRVSALQIQQKRQQCKHGIFDEMIHYKLCKGCGAFVPFRNPLYAEMMGAIGTPDTYESVIPKTPDITVILHECK